jgi:predicted branched-subunit amino acid permease
MSAAPHEADTRRRIHRQAASVALAVAPFGVVFGVACADAGLSWLDATGFSALVFAGSSQFAAVGVLADGGTALAAIGAGLLLNLRSLAFGVALAPDLAAPLWKRAVLAQLVIDESTAVATLQDERRWRRYGFLAGGLGVFVVWNATTLVGVTLASLGDEFVTEWGLDAAAPAAFLALVWPRLIGAGGSEGRRIALLGAAVATLAVPLVPPGVPILLAGAGVLAGRRSGGA